MVDYDEKSIKMHRELGGKWSVRSKFPLESRDDLSIAYTPGIGAVSQAIYKHPEDARDLTMKGNSVAIVSDGSAVLGYGNLGPQAALPVMEGKAILFKHFAGIDGVPIVLDVHEPEEIIAAVRAIAPTFGGINLEDIAAPKCFQVERELMNLGIPVFHDDQHGTAIVLLAALLNACRVVDRPFRDLKVVINGAGAAGTAIAKLLKGIGLDDKNFEPVADVIVCDSKGVISKSRTDLTPMKKEFLTYTNKNNVSGSVFDALKKTHVFVGVSKENILQAEHVRSMAVDPLIFAMANPIPEIMPEVAKKAGAAVVGTGRSDLPNQVNNVLAFPGIFRGALDAKATQITEKMKIAAAYALASAVEQISPDSILPDPLDRKIPLLVAKAVKESALEDME